MDILQCLIIGSGPAGYTAAIYAARANLNPLLIDGPQQGGQLTITTEVENFPGYADGVQPFQMMDDMRRQAQRFGTAFRSGSVTRVDMNAATDDNGKPLHRVVVDDKDELWTRTLIIATGASAKWLGLPSEKALMGRGVSGCATCDGFFYRGKTVAVVGGGDTACEEATYLSGLCKKVYMIVRKPYLRAAQIMQQRVLNNEKIEVLFEYNTLQVTGEQKVTGADLVYRKGEPDEAVKHIELDGFFVAIGHHPNTGLFKDSLTLDQEGYICVEGDSPRTGVPGVFAAGDCADPHYRQAVVAAAAGCKAAIEADRYLK